MRDYGKVYATFWTSSTTSNMTDDAKMLALYLMTCSHATIAGVFRVPDGYATADMGWTAERVQQGFSELVAKGFANRCGTTNWVWIREHLKWNRPENPNQCKSAAKIAQSVPDECAWKLDFMRAWGKLLGLEQPEPVNPSETVSEPLPNQYQEQEQEQEENTPDDKSSSSAAPTVPCPYEKIVASYHEHLPSLPRAKLMTAKRQRELRKLWGWVLRSCRSDGTRRATTAEEALAWIGDYFERASTNDFLMGRTERSGVHAGWRCDLDFLLTERGMTHVIERTEAAA
jgi:hypothetical protein